MAPLFNLLKMSKLNSFQNIIYTWIKRYIFQRNTLLFTIIIWILFQIVYVTLFKYSELVSDPGFYVYYAEECIKHDTMFPDYSNFHSEYIYSPGWINFIIVWIKIFESVELIPYFNIILNILILWLLYKITIVTTESKSISYLVLYIFMILPSNSTISLHLYTEIPFEILSMLSFYLIFSKKYWHIAIAGICIALAQWIRPLGVAWILAALFLLIYQKRNYKAVITYAISILITSGSIACMTYQNFPKPIFQAQTGGVNLIMGANDKATGGYCGEARRSPDGLGYLPGLFDSTSYTRVKYYVNDTAFVPKYSDKYTYLEVDSIYKARSFNWIAKNPEKWISLIPQKIYLLLNSAPSFAYTQDQNNSHLQIMRGISIISSLIGKMFVFIVLLSFVGLVMPFWKNYKMIYVLIPIIITSAMTVATSSMVRYNFIMIPFILIFACYSLKLLYDKYLRIN